jgi:hypothetical protein
MVLADTPVQPLAPRRRYRIWRRNRNSSPLPYTKLYEMVRERRVQRLGATRQELLSGIREASQFRRVRTDLRPFADVFLRAPDDEEAAQMSNKGRSAGVASTAMLICAVALEQGWQIFTTDRDFNHYARAIPIQLFSVA